jgi:hypothetical protein
MNLPYHAGSFFLHRRSRAAAQEVPPELLQFRHWLAVLSEKSAKQQDANEKKKRCAAFLEDGLNGAAAPLGAAAHRGPKPKPKPKCKHGRQRNQCKDCGTGICEHRRRKSQCKICSPNNFCKHKRRKHRCKDCRTGK